MKIYLSYKQTGIPEEELEKNLLFFKKEIEKLWHSVFIYYFDDNSDLPPEELNKRFLNQIKESDLVLAFVNYKDKSEWQLLELGMAYSLWKEIKILINKKVKENYYLIYGLWKVYKFDKIEEMDLINII